MRSKHLLNDYKDYVKSNWEIKEIARLRSLVENRSAETKDIQRSFSLYSGKDSTCGTKVRFTMNESIVQAASWNSKKKLQTMVPYLCPFCNYWHIGHYVSEREMKEVLK